MGAREAASHFKGADRLIHRLSAVRVERTRHRGGSLLHGNDQTHRLRVDRVCHRQLQRAPMRPLQFSRLAHTGVR